MKKIFTLKNILTWSAVLALLLLLFFLVKKLFSFSPTKQVLAWSGINETTADKMTSENNPAGRSITFWESLELWYATNGAWRPF